ncbi:MAG: helix-turn-helix domain-containing protein, partial [Candidatus Marinimicrobia bacterium]|nr:helix-turn-helix domain-containing protein [Candidatus Neomarinimicrobiota bacterium]
MKNPTQKAILSIMGPEPMSALDIANQINFPREKIYYHLKKLEKANKIFVSETEIINGITKKKYLKVTSQLTQGASERGVSEKDTVQEQNIINEITVLDQEDEDLGEDRGSAASVEDEIADEPVQETPEMTDLSPLQDQEFVQKESGNNTLVQNLMKAKGIVPDTENEAQRTHPPDPSSPPETDIGRTIEKRRMSDDRRTTGERRKESERRVEEKKESVGDEKRSGQERRKGKEKRVSADRRKAIDRKQEAEKKKAKKPVLQSNWLYLYRLLSGYSKTVTFVQKGNRVNFLHATIKRKGFQVHKKQTYMLPLAVNEDTTIHTLPQLIHHVFTEKFKLGERKKYYVAVYSSEYKFEIDFLKIPILKKNELYDYMLMKLGKMFSVDPNNLIIDWTINDVQDKKDTTQDAICLISDKTPILNDSQYLLEQNIQLRYTTSIAKIQYDQFLFNHGADSDGNALLLYIGKSFTRITLVNDWKLVESRKSSIGLDDFLDLYLKLNERNENIDYESARKHMLTRPFIGDDSKPLKTVYEKLISEIELSLSHFRKKNLLIGNNILISGIVSTIPKIVDQMKTSLGMDISHLNVPKFLDKKQHEDLEEYYDNIGLLLDPKDQLNLLPYRHRQNFKFFFPTKLMEIILAGILVVFAAVVSVQYNAFISIKGPVAEKEYLVKSALMERDTFFKF